MLFMVSILDFLACLFYHFHLAPWHSPCLSFLPGFLAGIIRLCGAPGSPECPGLLWEVDPGTPCRGPPSF